MEGQKLILLLALVGLILGSPISAKPMGWDNQGPDSSDVIGYSPYDIYENFNYPFGLAAQYIEPPESSSQHPLETVDNMFIGETDPHPYFDVDDWS